MPVTEKLLKVEAPVMVAMEVVAKAIVCVPLAVKVPLLVKLPFKVYVPDVGESVQVEPLVKVPATVKLVLAVTVVEEQEVVRLLKLRVVPEFVTVPPPLTVIVPAEAVKLPVEPLVNVPAMLKLLEVVTVAPDAVVRLKKVGAEPEVEIDEPVFRVIVPAVGANAAEVVSAPPTVAVVEAVIGALIVRFLKVVLAIAAPELE